LALRSRGELETEFLERFQQFTSPVMAKGVEDTMFYCYNRMVGLNEVGGAPECNGIDLDKFHSYFAKLQSEHPKTMNSLSTHDTKRSEDVRARLAVLTEIPSQWRSTLHRWSRRNQPFKTGAFPDRNTEYFLYQTLIGAWPIGIERITAYMEKAAREAKEHTSWTLQNKEFEDALKLFIERLYASQEFTGEVDSFVAGIISSGRINSLAQTLIKCTAPGVPDAYQGSEIWDLRLVDPDNRGNIDYEQRQSLLAEIQAGIGVEDIVKKMDSGLPKLWLIYKSLQLRREHPEWFGEASDYIALPVEGSKQAHLIAFRRGDAVAVLAPRWNLKLAGVFGATTVELPAGRWTNILTGEILNGEKMRAQNLFHRFPVALLVKDDGVIDAAI
jgi:(1->4)-alpha-D-glucan 1-alpha-D-glucosylmutase